MSINLVSATKPAMRRALREAYDPIPHGSACAYVGRVAVFVARRGKGWRGTVGGLKVGR